MVLNEAARRLAVSMRQTEDELVRDELVASASVIDCTAGTNGDSPTDITESDIDTVTETLLSNDAYSISDMIEGVDKFGTGPVADSFFGMANSDLSSDFRGIAGFLHKSQYPSQGEVLRSEWGNVGNVRILISSIGAKSANTSSNGNDVYAIPICGMEAYACVDIESYGSQFVYRAPIYNDPLAQNATVAWKMATVPVIQNDAWVINLRCTKR